MNGYPISDPIMDVVNGLNLTRSQRALLLQDLRADAYGTMEDRQNRQRKSRLLDDQKELAAEIQTALEAGDFKRANRLGKKLVALHGSIPARPPRRERPRCTAIAKTTGRRCQMAAYWQPGDPAPRNGKCRIHGGMSTGPKTAEGRAAIAESNRRRSSKESDSE